MVVTSFLEKDDLLVGGQSGTFVPVIEGKAVIQWSFFQFSNKHSYLFSEA